MTKTNTTQPGTLALSATQLLEHWLGHRGLTRKTIEAFPEEQFFGFSLAGMRTPAQLIGELIGLGAPGVRQVVLGTQEELNDTPDYQNSKARALKLWDESTEEIVRLWDVISEEQLNAQILLFGRFPNSGINSILYFIDNEIHHRAQIFVYLRAVGVQPPFFWDRG